MTASISRRGSLVTLAKAMACSALPSIACADAAPMRVALIPIWDVATYYAAEQQRYFTAENLACTPSIVRGGNLIAGFTGIAPAMVQQMKSPPAHADIVPGSLARLTTMMTQTGLLTSNVDLRSKIFA